MTLLVCQKQWKVVYLLKLYCHCIGGRQFNTLRQSVCLVENQITVWLWFPLQLHHDVFRSFRLYVGPYACFQLGPPWLTLRYSLVLTFCEPFSFFHENIDNLFLCDNVLHKIEILYSSLIRLCFERNPAEARDLAS